MFYVKILNITLYLFIILTIIKNYYYKTGIVIDII